MSERVQHGYPGEESRASPPAPTSSSGRGVMYVPLKLLA